MSRKGQLDQLLAEQLSVPSAGKCRTARLSSCTAAQDAEEPPFTYVARRSGSFPGCIPVAEAGNAAEVLSAVGAALLARQHHPHLAALIAGDRQVLRFLLS